MRALIMFTMMAFCTLAHAQSAAYKKAQSLIKEKDYFSARGHYRLHEKQMSHSERLVMEAFMGGVFNRPAESNVAIAALFKTHSKTLSDSLKLEMLRLRQANHVRLFEYKEALRAGENIVNSYNSLLSDADRDDLKNTAQIWNALLNSPKQVVEMLGDTNLKMKRDKAGLTNLQVNSGEVSADFIFDTGANLSTVTESVAKKFKMTVLDGTVAVRAITGAMVPAGIATCPELRIGNIKICNAVFLVFPDEALAFPQIQYQINGIIGFPVMEGLREVQLTKKDEFVVPQVPSEAKGLDMALDFLTPVISINGDYYTFDTGATATMLYRKFYDRHKDELAQPFVITDLQFGGAGGMTTKKGYKITYSPVINNRKLVLSDVALFTEPIGESKDYYFGNIGQDIIRQFDKMTISLQECL